MLDCIFSPSRPLFLSLYVIYFLFVSVSRIGLSLLLLGNGNVISHASFASRPVPAIIVL